MTVEVTVQQKQEIFENGGWLKRFHRGLTIGALLFLLWCDLIRSYSLTKAVEGGFPIVSSSQLQSFELEKNSLGEIIDANVTVFDGVR